MWKGDGIGYILKYLSNKINEHSMVPLSRYILEAMNYQYGFENTPRRDA